MTYSPRTLVWVAMLFLLPLTEARADLIPWMYSWSRYPDQIMADAPGTGYITLTSESSNFAVGDSNVVATNLKTFSTATVDNKDVFTSKTYSLSMHLTDVDSSASATLTFTGEIDGWLTAQSSYLRNTFTGQTTQSVILGMNLYVVTMDGYTPPGIPGSDNSGSISAKATVRVETLVVAQVPEPGTLALAGVGLTLLVAARRRRVSDNERGA